MSVSLVQFIADNKDRVIKHTVFLKSKEYEMVFPTIMYSGTCFIYKHFFTVWTYDNSFCIRHNDKQYFIGDTSIIQKYPVLNLSIYFAGKRYYLCKMLFTSYGIRNKPLIDRMPCYIVYDIKDQPDAQSLKRLRRYHKDIDFHFE